MREVKTIHVETLPDCDFCGNPAEFDGKTFTGAHAHMCEDCKPVKHRPGTPLTKLEEKDPDVKPQAPSFEDWLKAVDRNIPGLGHRDLPDRRWRDEYDAGVSPEEAAQRALNENGAGALF